ncbi:MAG: HAD-IA family hydrolase [Sulfitobacter sp.]
MTQALRLVIFDVDGTLVDSQNDIVTAMGQAFDAVGAPPPSLAEVLGIVGLSLDVAMAKLAPAYESADRAVMVQAYKDAYITMRAQVGAAQSSPLYPGALDLLQSLRKRDDIVLGVATGKSKRGLDKLIEAHGLDKMFVTQQVADFHPSKPHPSMIFQAMTEAGTDPANTVMIGDTSFDMDMAAAAGVCGIGVGWGYHPVSRLTSALHVVDGFDALSATLTTLWDVAA